ncbi:GNAT family N-acetyltransferase [Planotetraspora sp. A-T 1434]|uniref:GNAT family N-acetyltransferase n=1 Tax=Planotetraspora sp. A-T 1434 TaxID=2979219 RepID=UPI0021BFC8C6|nr:GNAT family N-acetyltransferase [Planotetraspora sp. A-T 1434]MCT9929470.1 GNAT family N-acetyltransferase [Planotetraspora sp. A-T 1434]
MTQNDLTMRPITGREEIELFCRLPYVLNEEMAHDLDSGRRRPEWMWMALRGDRPVARLAWWARRENDPPFMLDTLDLDDATLEPERVDIGVRLLGTAMAAILPVGVRPPEYSRFLPPRWRDEGATRRMVEDRMAVLERSGARLLVERLRLEWRPGTPIPEPSRRLSFRPVGDREELVELMTLVLEGTLDAHSHADLARMTPAQAAVAQYDEELAAYQSPRDWWRIAMSADGDPVGFVIPARNSYNPIIAYLGVLPRHRGNGYAGDLLAEGTRILAEQGVPRIRAATDVGNIPMAEAFHRAGYVIFQREINMAWG